MDHQMAPAKVSAIVAAYNEAERIGPVLEVLAASEVLDEIIVVDDGSTDGTGGIVAGYPVRYLRLDPNRGKGEALEAGIRAASGDVLFFADADISGLTTDVIEEAVSPVRDGVTEMFVVMRSRWIYVLRSLFAFTPLLGGERALTSRLWMMVPSDFKARFRIEAALNFYAVHYGNGLRYRVFKGITNTAKERKFGLSQGLKRRAAMSWDVLTAMLTLQRRHAPQSARARRQLARSAMLGLLGMFLGFAMLLLAYLGPATFIGRFLSEERVEDPGSPLIAAIAFIGNSLSLTALSLLGGVLIVVNLIFVVIGILRLATAQTRLEG